MSQAAAIAERMRKEVARQCKALVMDIDAGMRRRGATPVDTGHARRNWVPSVGEPHTGTSADDSAHDAGLASVLSYVLASGPLWVCNNVPYIRALNYGHSKQAPAGFVERAVALALTKAEARARDGVDISASIRESFASRSDNADGHGPAPDGADGAGWSGGEYG